MKKCLLACLAIFLFAFQNVAQENHQFTQSIYFETGSDVLTAESQEKLTDLTQNLVASPDFDLNIEAFTDDRGSEIYNRSLAERRAASTVNFLISKNVQPRSTVLKSIGEAEQKTAASLEETRRINRRVDILVTAFYFSNLGSLLERLENQQVDEVFQFQNSDDEQTFTSARGTQIVVPGDAFQFEDGTFPAGQIQFKLREAYDPAAWFLNKLSMETTDGQLLTTAGMVFTEATSENRPLRLRSEKKITVAVPFEKQRDDAMKLFYGKKHDVENANSAARMSWQAVPTSSMRNTLESNDSVWVSTKGGKVLRPKRAVQKFPLPAEGVAFLKSQQFEVPEKPEKPKFLDALKYPGLPVLPSKPYFTMRKPERKNFKFQPENISEKLKSKKERRAIEQKQYEDKLAFYEKSKLEYEKRLAEYESKMVNSDAEIAAFDVARINWRAAAQRRLETLYSFENQNYANLAVAGLNTVLQESEKIVLSCDDYGHYFLEKLAFRADRIAQTNNTATSSKILFRLGDAMIPLRETYIEEPTGAESNNHFFREDLAKVQAAARRDHSILNREFLVKMMQEKTGFEEQANLAFGEFKAKCWENGVQNGEITAMRAYVFDITQMGWCNVDALMKYNSQQALAVEVNESEEAMLTVMFSEMKVAVNLTDLKNGKYRSNLKLPLGQKVKLVAMKVKNGVAHLAVHEFVVGRGEVPELAYRSLPMAELKKELQRLNS